MDKPNRFSATPEDVDAWLREELTDERRLAFYRWIGTSAVREAVADAKDQLHDDPAPAEHRYYSQDSVEELLDLMAPGEGDIGYPSVLPTNSSEQLTREQAEACLKITQDWVALRAGSGWADEMKLYPPGFHCEGWAVALTGGPEDWPWHVSQANIWPDGVFAEPGSDWYLGLYPDRNR